jgi:hypothetical protein
LFSKPTFDNFIVGDSNRTACIAAREVARYPGIRYNPLFLCGETGTGKSHLLLAIREEITNGDPSAQIYHENYSALSARMRSSPENGLTASIRERIPHYDALLLDDIENDEVWPSLQPDLIRWIDRYVREEKQIVLTSAHPPFELVPIEPRLLSRIQHGLIVPLGGLDQSVREAIASLVLEGEGYDLPLDALALLGQLPVTDMREMAGILHRVVVTLRADRVALSRGWLIRTLRTFARNGEIRRFPVVPAERPPYGAHMPMVDVSSGEEGLGVDAPDQPSPGVAAVAKGQGLSANEEDAVTGREEEAVAPEISKKELPSVEGVAEAERREEEILLDIDESDGFIMEWDREEDRLLNDI